jgi:hypothetical protein
VAVSHELPLGAQLSLITFGTGGAVFREEHSQSRSLVEQTENGRQKKASLSETLLALDARAD